jgi:hypothetical protein
MTDREGCTRHSDFRMVVSPRPSAENPDVFPAGSASVGALPPAGRKTGSAGGAHSPHAPFSLEGLHPGLLIGRQHLQHLRR